MPSPVALDWCVTGARGMLGRDLTRTLRAAGQRVRPFGRTDLDVRDPVACRDAFAGAQVVVNAAAWTDVDGAEDDEGGAFAVNAVGAANVALAAGEVGARMVQISTDYVFDGRAERPYPTDAAIGPINAYGRTKAAGEWSARAAGASVLVVRTAWAYGEHGRNFLTTVLRAARDREYLDVVDDQRGQPTWTGDLAAYLLDTVLRDAPPGIHHGTCTGETTWYGLAREAFAAAGLQPDRIRPTTSAAMPRRAARPGYSVLETDGRMPPWQDSLRRAMPALMSAVNAR